MLPHQVVRSIMQEVQQLRQQPPEGIRVELNEEDLADLSCFLLGPAGTPYEGGCFKVKMAFPDEYPQVPPKCHFVTKIFHPNVSKAGEICVNTLKKDWHRDLGIAHILLTIKCLLIVPNPESALNEEAGKLLLEAYNDYFTRAKIMTSIHASSQTEYKQLLSRLGEHVGECIAGSGSGYQSASGTSVESPIKSTGVTLSAASGGGENEAPAGDNSIQSATILVTDSAKKRVADGSVVDKKKAEKKRSLKRL